MKNPSPDRVAIQEGITHGNADEVVDVDHSLRMYRALIEGGAKGELHIFDGVGQEFNRDPALGRQCASLMTLFLDRHVKPRPTSGAK